MWGIIAWVLFCFVFLIPTKFLWYSDFRSWQAESVDSGCSNCTQTSPPYPEPFCGDALAGHVFTAPAGQYSSGNVQPPPLKVTSERRRCSTGTAALPGTHRVCYCCLLGLSPSWSGEKIIRSYINNFIWAPPSWQHVPFEFLKMPSLGLGSLFTFYLFLDRIRGFFSQKASYFYCGLYLICKYALVSVFVLTQNCNSKDHDQIPVLLEIRIFEGIAKKEA